MLVAEKKRLDTVRIPVGQHSPLRSRAEQSCDQI